MLLFCLLPMLVLSFSDAGTVSFNKNPAPMGLYGTAEEIEEQLRLKRENLCSLDPKYLDEGELSASILQVFALHYQEDQPITHVQKYRILCKKSLDFPYAKSRATADSAVASASLRKFYSVVKKYTSDVNDFRLQLCKIWKSIPTAEPRRVPSYDPCHEHTDELGSIQAHDGLGSIQAHDGRPEQILDELLADILEASNDREAASYVMGKIIDLTRPPIPSRRKEIEDVPEFAPEIEKPKRISEKAEEFLFLQNVPNTTIFRNLKEDLEGIADESIDSEVLQLVSDVEGLVLKPKLRYRKGVIPCRKKFSYEGCGKRQDRKRVKRIVNGSDAMPGHWPWTVVVNVNPVGLNDNICGGTLVSDRFVLTAGHCIVSAMLEDRRTLDYFSVKVGVLKWKDHVEAIKVKAFYAAPLYDSDSYADDIALLELEKPVAFNQTVQPICLPLDFEDFIGQQAYVTGWGFNQSGGALYSEVLQETEVQVLSQHKCCHVLKFPSDSLEKRKAALCAGYEDGRTDACQGDSGGPLMVETECGRWVLIGVVSYGENCGETNRPGIYASVSYFRTWINQITKLEDKEEPQSLERKRESEEDFRESQGHTSVVFNETAQSQSPEGQK